MRTSPAAGSSSIPHRHGRDSLALYLDVLRDSAPMDRDTELRIAERATTHDPEAVEQLVRTNLRFVVSVAKRYRNLGLTFEDLIGEGNLGLLRAAERFDPSRGVRFASYALWWIRHAILKALAEQGTAVRRPTHDVMAQLRLRRRIDGVRQALGREPTTREVSDALQVDEARVLAHRATWGTAVPLDEVRYDGTRGGGFDVSGTGNHAAAQRDEELRINLNMALAELPPRERRVLQLSFGLEQEAPSTLAGIAALLKLSPQRVNTIRGRALSRLRTSRHAGRLATLLR